jgi:hypothetical protein
MVRATFFAIALLGAAQAMIIRRQASGCTCAGEINDTVNMKYCQSIVVTQGRRTPRPTYPEL